MIIRIDKTSSLTSSDLFRLALKVGDELVRDGNRGFVIRAKRKPCPVIPMRPKQDGPEAA